MMVGSRSRVSDASGHRLTQTLLGATPMPAKDRTVQAGIDQIRHVASGKVYIGSAVDIQRRWRYHKGELKRDTHHNQILQRTWRKYGPDAFVFDVLQVIADKGTLVRIEQEWLDRVRPFDRKVGF